MTATKKKLKVSGKNGVVPPMAGICGQSFSDRSIKMLLEYGVDVMSIPKLSRMG